jgi:eukaryotic-like serine/threonine-protein kinase
MHPINAPVRPGTIIGSKFALLRLIGEGAAGAVYEAEDTVMGRRVALKLLHPQYATHPELVHRFRREAQAAATIDHPNIVTVHELGQRKDGTLYIVQEYLRGENVREGLDARGAFELTAALDVIAPIMGALVAAHGRNIVHRDIKPENIFLARNTFDETVPKLIDFGIAKMPLGGSATSKHATRSGALWGTVAYMSPEQTRGSTDVDPRTDVWALGVVLFEMLAGAHPFEAATEADTMLKILVEPLPLLAERLPTAPSALRDVIERALERDPAERFQSVEEMLRAVIDATRKVDPSLAARHARSLPRSAASRREGIALALEDDEELRTGELQFVFDPKPKEPVRPAPRFTKGDPSEIEDVITSEYRVALPSVEAIDAEDATPLARWESGRPPPPDATLAAVPAPAPSAEEMAQAAQDALRVNALDDAITIAEEITDQFPHEAELVARMRLVQAISHFWLGHYADAERCAIFAAQQLPRGSTGWHAAVGHQAMAGAYLGKNQQLAPMVFDLLESKAHETITGGQIVTFSRLVVLLVRAGSFEFAQRIFQKIDPAVHALPRDEPFVTAWVDLARAEFAAHSGDPALYLRHVESSVKCFASAGDARNACLQRANVGNAYMQLGLFDRAETMLREALGVAEPMKLSFVAAIRGNLGHVLAQRGALEEAMQMERSAMDLCREQGHLRFAAVARCYLAMILLQERKLEPAQAEARAAIEASTSAPGIRAYALATMGDILLAASPRDSLVYAQQAMDILDLLGGLEEGESLVRLVYARALRAAGRVDDARSKLEQAERRLLARAGTISDRQARKTFLENISENAKTLALAAEWSAEAENEVDVALDEDEPESVGAGSSG